MDAWVKVGGNEPRSRDSLKTELRRGASLLINFLKNSTGNPSGPGDLLFCMALIEDLISSTFKGTSSSLAVMGSTLGISRFWRKEVISVVSDDDSDS